MTARFDGRAIPAAATESKWDAPDGQSIRRIDWSGGAAPSGKLAPDNHLRGSLLFLPGRGDFYEKYLETLDHWHDRGWRVTALDWRGQAGSGRFGASPTTGHVDDFSTWIKDVSAFWAEWATTTPAPHVIVGHSMGGHLVLRALAENRIAPAAAVLSAPMLGFLAPGPTVLLHALAGLMCRIGDPERPAWGTSEKPGAKDAARPVLLTHDERRYADEAYWKQARPYLAMGPGSWRWVERAYASIRGLDRTGVLEAVRIPVLVLGTRYDALVAYPAIARAAHRMPHARLVTWGREARHELLREVDAVRDRAIAAIDDFLDEAAPVPRSE
jgi:lysophospholipase